MAATYAETGDNISVQLKELGPIDGSDGTILISIEGRTFSVSPATNVVLKGIMHGVSNHVIAGQINDKRLTSEPVNASDIADLSLKLKTNFLSTNKARGGLSRVFFRVPLIRFEGHSRILQALGFLFKSPFLFFFSFAATVAFNAAALAFLLPLNVHALASFHCVALVTACSFLLAIVHEFGHVAAARAYGVRVTHIGIGLYFGFPVLYTDLNEIWRLHPSKRIIINMAGVYLQLATNIPLVIAWQFFRGTPRVVILAAIFSNVAAALINAIPFSKLDGYWVISDAASKPALESDSNEYLARLLRDLIRLKRPEVLWGSKWMLVYAVLQFMFYAVISVALWYSIVPFAHELVKNLSASHQLLALFKNHFLQAVILLTTLLKLTIYVHRLVARRVREHP